MTRPHFRDDGIPTRIDEKLLSPAEHAITGAMRAVEATGASGALTEALGLLIKARDLVANHVEGGPLPQTVVE